MNTKLTLTIEQTVIEKAKKYAKDNERSLSDLIENYLKALTKESDVNDDVELTPVVKSLIDTDVILDFFFDRQPFAENASKIFSLSESKKIISFVTPVIISNVYYLLRQTATHEKVIEKLKLLSSITRILMMDNNVVFRALNSDFKDFEDALQNYSAELNKEIDIIITRNIKDFKYSKLAVMTPDQFLKTKFTGQ